MRRTMEERFWEKVDKSGDCWLWLGAFLLIAYVLPDDLPKLPIAVASVVLLLLAIWTLAGKPFWPFHRSAKAPPDRALARSLAGSLSLERVGLLAGVDTGTPTTARIQPTLTWLNGASIPLAYYVRSMRVIVENGSADLDLGQGTRGTIGPGKTSLYQGPTLAGQSVGAPLEVQVRYVLDYGPVAEAPVIRSTRTLLLPATVRGHGIASLGSSFVVVDSSEEFIEPASSQRRTRSRSSDRR